MSGSAKRRRRAHVAGVTAALARGEWRWLARAAWRLVQLRVAPGRARPLFATLAVTWRCNYRCTFCDLPDRARGDPPLATLVERLTAIAASGALAVGLTGGEPLLHPQLFEVIAAARRLGLLVHLNSNGSRLTEAAVAPLLASGLHSINLSLDGATAATHDALRRVPGSFAQIERTVRALLAARRRGSPRLALVMAVGAENAGEVAPFLAVARAWGVDGAGFLPHHEFVGPRAPLPPASVAKLASALAAVADDPLQDNSPAYLGAIAPFLDGAPMPQQCSAPASHLAIDPDGVRYPCVPLMTLTRGGSPLAAGAPPPLPADLREEVCRRCWWNCHRELDLSLHRLAAPR